MTRTKPSTMGEKFLKKAKPNKRVVSENSLEVETPAKKSKLEIGPQPVRENENIYDTLKDRTIPWGDRLKLARYVWVNVAAVPLPFRENLIVECLCTGLVNVRKSGVSEADISAIWETLAQLLQSDRVKTKRVEISLKNSFVVSIVEELKKLKEQSLLKVDSDKLDSLLKCLEFTLSGDETTSANHHLLRDNTNNLLAILENLTGVVGLLPLNRKEAADCYEQAISCLTTVYSCFLKQSASAQMTAAATAVCCRLLAVIAHLCETDALTKQKRLSGLFAQFVRRAVFRRDRLVPSDSFFNETVLNTIKAVAVEWLSWNTLVRMGRLIIDAFLIYRTELKLKSDECMGFIEELFNLLVVSSTTGTSDCSTDMVIAIDLLKAIVSNDLYDPNDSREAHQKLQKIVDWFLSVASNLFEIQLPMVLLGTQVILQAEPTLLKEKLNDIIVWCHKQTKLKFHKDREVLTAVDLIVTYSKLKQMDVFISGYVETLTGSRVDKVVISRIELMPFGVAFGSMGATQASDVAKKLIRGLKTLWKQSSDVSSSFKAVQLALLFDVLTTNIQPLKAVICVETCLKEVRKLRIKVGNGGDSHWRQVLALLKFSSTRLLVVRRRYRRTDQPSDLEMKFESEVMSSEVDPIAIAIEKCAEIMLNPEADHLASTSPVLTALSFHGSDAYCEDNFCGRTFIWEFVTSKWSVFAPLLSTRTGNFTDLLSQMICDNTSENSNCQPSVSSTLMKSVESLQFWEFIEEDVRAELVLKLCVQGGKLLGQSAYNPMMIKQTDDDGKLLKLLAAQMCNDDKNRKELDGNVITQVGRILEVLRFVPLSYGSVEYHLVFGLVLNSLQVPRKFTGKELTFENSFTSLEHTVTTLGHLLKLFDKTTDITTSMSDGFWDEIISNLLCRCEEVSNTHPTGQKLLESPGFWRICLHIIGDVFDRQVWWLGMVNSFVKTVSGVRTFPDTFRSEVYAILLTGLQGHLQRMATENAQKFQTESKFKLFKAALMEIDEWTVHQKTSAVAKVVLMLLDVSSYFDSTWEDLGAKTTANKMLKTSVDLNDNDSLALIAFPLELFKLRTNRLVEWRNEVLMSQSEMLVAVTQQRFERVVATKWTKSVIGSTIETALITQLLKDWQFLLSSLLAYGKQSEIVFPVVSEDNVVGCLIFYSSLCESCGVGDSSEELRKFLQPTVINALQRCANTLGGRGFVETIRFITAALKFGMVGKVSAHLIGFCLTLASQLPVALAELKSWKDDSESFTVLFTVTAELLNVLLVKFPGIVVKMIPSYMAVFQHLLKTLVQQSAGFSIQRSDVEVTRLVRCARLITRLCVVIAGHSEEFGKVSAYVLANYLDSIKGVTIEDVVESTLKPGIYRLFDLCDKYGVSLLLTNLQPGSRDIFKLLYEDYKKFFKYSGFV